jgi:hypothetical protein
VGRIIETLGDRPHHDAAQDDRDTGDDECARDIGRPGPVLGRHRVHRVHETPPRTASSGRVPKHSMSGYTRGNPTNARFAPILLTRYNWRWGRVRRINKNQTGQ